MNVPVTIDFDAKNTLFLQHTTLNCRGRIVSFDRPLVMGILNITPDSFYDGGRYQSLDEALKRAAEMIGEGADLLDIGAVSTRPGSTAVDAAEEVQRMIPVINAIHGEFPEAILSVDTFRSETARKAVEAGASIINDISGGTVDIQMFETVAKLQVPYILMHMQGSPATMQVNPRYADVTGEVLRWLADRVFMLRQSGVNDIIIDPGFGFGKSVEQNFTMLRQLEFFSILQLPLLVGISRKSMIYKTLNISAEESLTGSIALQYQALLNGASILRVHDVKAAVQTVQMFEMVQKS